MEDLKNIMNPNGKMVLSGILEEKSPIVYEAIDKPNLKVIETMHQNQWIAIVVSL